MVDHQKGESIQFIDTSFQEFARRLVLQYNGRSCETVFVEQGAPPVDVRVFTNLDIESIDLVVGGKIQKVKIQSGQGTVRVATDKTGTFAIAPADRKTFCAAGESLLSIEVTPPA